MLPYVEASGDDARGLLAATSKDGRTWTSVSATAAISPDEFPAFDSDLALHACLLRPVIILRLGTRLRREEGGPYGWKLRIGAVTIFVDN